MALSTPPPPPDPPTSTATTPRPLFPPNPRPPPPTNHPHPFYSNHHHHLPANSTRLPSNPNPNYPHLVPQDVVSSIPTVTTATANILYPVASSGRGFLVAKQTPSSVTLASPTPTNSSPLYYHQSSRAASGLSSYGPSSRPPPFGYSHPDPGLVHQGMGGYVTTTGRPHINLHQHGVMPGVIKGVPISGASSQSQHKITVSPNSRSDCNGHKDLREKGKDESALSTIRDRKVRISDNASMYALCRSWLRNGSPEENQLQYIDAARSLPRPLPLSAQDTASPVNKVDDKEEQEDEESADHLTPQELLQRHVKHAKRVRSRLREERLRRIARYKTRLALLLPPMGDPQIRNDLATGN